MNNADAAAGNFSYPAHGRGRWRLNDLLADKECTGEGKWTNLFSPFLIISGENLMKIYQKS